MIRCAAHVLPSEVRCPNPPPAFACFDPTTMAFAFACYTHVANICSALTLSFKDHRFHSRLARFLNGKPFAFDPVSE